MKPLCAYQIRFGLHDRDALSDKIAAEEQILSSFPASASRYVRTRFAVLVAFLALVTEAKAGEAPTCQQITSWVRRRVYR